MCLHRSVRYSVSPQNQAKSDQEINVNAMPIPFPRNPLSIHRPRRTEGALNEKRDCCTMAALLLQLVTTALTLVSCMATRGLSSSNPEASAVNQGTTNVLCVPCENLFRKLERVEDNGKLSRVVKVQLRGEPKSGTGIMFDWATAAMVRMCDHLQLLFGEEV